MGSWNFKADTLPEATKVNKAAFIYHYVIGRGGFGKVWKVENK